MAPRFWSVSSPRLRSILTLRSSVLAESKLLSVRACALWWRISHLRVLRVVYACAAYSVLCASPVSGSKRDSNRIETGALLAAGYCELSLAHASWFRRPAQARRSGHFVQELRKFCEGSERKKPPVATTPPSVIIKSFEKNLLRNSFR